MGRNILPHIPATVIPRTVFDIPDSPLSAMVDFDDKTERNSDETAFQHVDTILSPRLRDFSDQSSHRQHVLHSDRPKMGGVMPQNLVSDNFGCSRTLSTHMDHDYLLPQVAGASRIVLELQDAVTSGEEAEVRRVLSEGGPHLLQVYTRHTRSTPLHLAAALAHSHLVRLLVSAGCTIDSFDNEGNTPLHICCENADTQTTSTLLSASQTSNPRGTWRALNTKNYAGMTCFILAAATGNSSLMTLLARAGCDVNGGDGLSGRIALHHAAAAGNINLVRFLLQTLKLEVNRRDFGGNTALGLVGQHRRQDLALLLIRHGGEVRVLD